MSFRKLMYVFLLMVLVLTFVIWFLYANWFPFSFGIFLLCSFTLLDYGFRSKLPGRILIKYAGYLASIPLIYLILVPGNYLDKILLSYEFIIIELFATFVAICALKVVQWLLPTILVIYILFMRNIIDRVRTIGSAAAPLERIYYIPSTLPFFRVGDRIYLIYTFLTSLGISSMLMKWISPPGFSVTLFEGTISLTVFFIAPLIVSLTLLIKELCIMSESKPLYFKLIDIMEGIILINIISLLYTAYKGLSLLELGIRMFVGLIIVAYLTIGYAISNTVVLRETYRKMKKNALNGSKILRFQSEEQRGRFIIYAMEEEKKLYGYF